MLRFHAFLPGQVRPRCALRTVRLITVRSARSGSRQDFRIRRLPKLLASSATTIIDRSVLRRAAGRKIPGDRGGTLIAIGVDSRSNDTSHALRASERATQFTARFQAAPRLSARARWAVKHLGTRAQ